MKYNPDLTYLVLFIVCYVEKLFYSDLNPSIILGPIIFIVVFTIAVFIIKPPTRIKRILKWKKA